MTTLKSTQIDSGILVGQIPAVSTALKFTGPLGPNAITTLTLPVGTDPTLLNCSLCVLDTFSATNDPTYNMWIPGDAAVTLAKDATSIKLINETSNTVQYLVVLR
ncbi:hypothetical protein D3C75_866940 [compost metagenome]